jgi:hypothetical protein
MVASTIDIRTMVSEKVVTLMVLIIFTAVVIVYSSNFSDKFFTGYRSSTADIVATTQIVV